MKKVYSKIRKRYAAKWPFPHRQEPLKLNEVWVHLSLTKLKEFPIFAIISFWADKNFAQQNVIIKQKWVNDDSANDTNNDNDNDDNL